MKLKWNQRPLPKEVWQGEDKRYYKLCPDCKKECSYLRRNYAIESYDLKKICKSCSNKKTENCHRGMYKDLIRTSWFYKFKTSAELRRYEWNISLEDVFKLYKNQGGKCALSGVEIGWSFTGGKHLASIDRIKSEIGYVPENIQLVHKDINFMKGKFTQEYFIKTCKAIAAKN